MQYQSAPPDVNAAMRQMMAMQQAIMSQFFGRGMDPFGEEGEMGMTGFPPMLTMGMGMGGLNEDLPGGGGGAVIFSSQQVFNSADPSQNYTKTTTAQAGPSGILEARTTVRDGRQGVERVGIRRQLGDRYTEVERTRHIGTGEESINKTAHNVENDDTEKFDQEWRSQATQCLPLYRSSSSGTTVPRITSSSHPSAGAEPRLAIADRPYYTSATPTMSAPSSASSASSSSSYRPSAYSYPSVPSSAYPTASGSFPSYSSPGYATVSGGYPTGYYASHPSVVYGQPSYYGGY